MHTYVGYTISVIQVIISCQRKYFVISSSLSVLLHPMKLHLGISISKGIRLFELPKYTAAAAEHGHVECIFLLIANRVLKLHISCSKPHNRCVSKLIDAGASKICKV